MGLSGDFAGLGSLAANLRKLASVPSRASRIAAQKLDVVIQRQYDTGTDPYGAAWNRLRPNTLAKGRFPPPLTDSWQMRDGTHVTPMAGAGIKVTFDAPWSVFHHTGFHVGSFFVEPRPVAPTGASFPAAWSAPIKEACAEAVRAVMGGR